MNIQQEGLGICSRCGTPIMQAINQPGVKGVCFGCQADGQAKTGRTVIVTNEIGAGALGRVETQEVEHQVNPASPLVKDVAAVRAAIAAKAEAKGVAPMPTPVALEPEPQGTVTVKVTIDELHKGDVLVTLLHAIYDGIDNMPPFKTLKETKKAIAVQEAIEAQLAKIEGANNA